MTKKRVYEYAKEHNTSSKRVIEELKKLNIEVKNHMSTISAEEQEKINQRFNPKPAGKPKTNDKPKQAPKQENKNAPSSNTKKEHKPSAQKNNP